MAAALVATAVWAWVLLDRSPGWFPWLRVVIVVAGVGAAVVILAGPVLRAATARGHMILAAVPVSLAVIAGLGGPLAYSLDTAASSYAGTSPSAGPPMTAAGAGLGGAREFGRGLLPHGAAGGGADFGAAGGGGFPGSAGGLGGGRTGRFPGGFGGIGGNAVVSSALARLLRTGASHYTWAAATDGADSAASMELAAGGVPVMAIGGFRGTDPAPSLARFEELVSAHRIHYYVAGGAGGGFARAGGFGGFGGAGGGVGGPGGGAGGARGAPGGGATDAARISAWVAAHFTATTVGGMTVYDLSTPGASS
jgi:hypothetical protein